MAEGRKELLMFNATQRLVHWLHTGAFALLMLTGIMIYVPWFSRTMASGEGGYVIRLLHRVGAVAFMLVTVIYIFFTPR
ncbi:MAG: hypothetical protein PVJ55_12170, partial [Anaerolineae bacterium]